MKKLAIAITFLAIGLTSCKKEGDKKEVKTEEAVKVEETTAAAKDAKVNLETTVVEWKGGHPVGESHNGTIKLSEGKLIVEGDKLKGGEFTIDMNSIVCLDVPADKGNEKLVGHLKNADFFDVEKFPTAKFVIAEVTENGDKIDVKGNLTIKDKTKAITFPATFKATDAGYSLTSDDFKVNRTDFGITYKSGSIEAALKDKAINDLLDFVVKVEATK